MTDTRPCLVQDLLPETGVGLISGQWGTYKTFVAIDLAMAVISGADFIRFPVRRRGGVLFIACEGQSEVAIRVKRRPPPARPSAKVAFCWTDTCPRLLDPNAAKSSPLWSPTRASECGTKFEPAGRPGHHRYRWPGRRLFQDRRRE